MRLWKRSPKSPDAAPSASGVSTPQANFYETSYEIVARTSTDEIAVGGGSFDHVGRLELSVLVMEGLKPADTVLDIGCGTGRLAMQAIPFLREGRYIGVDISQTMLDHAQRRVAANVSEFHCKVQWIKQTTADFLLPDQSVDMMCAFSVFTHMEHEDTYRYLRNAAKIVSSRGRLVLSCLPMNLQCSQDVFLASASDDLQSRWSKIRNVTTSEDLITAIAKLAGWSVLHWYPGDQANIRMWDTGQMFPFVQSICVLESRCD